MLTLQVKYLHTTIVNQWHTRLVTQQAAITTISTHKTHVQQSNSLSLLHILLLRLSQLSLCVWSPTHTQSESHKILASLFTYNALQLIELKSGVFRVNVSNAVYLVNKLPICWESRVTSVLSSDIFSSFTCNISNTFLSFCSAFSRSL